MFFNVVYLSFSKIRAVFFTINEGIIFLPDQNKKEAQILGQG